MVSRRLGRRCTLQNECLLPAVHKVLPAEPWRAGDGLQRTLRSRFQPRLTPSVRCCTYSCEGSGVHWPTFLVSH